MCYTALQTQTSRKESEVGHLAGGKLQKGRLERGKKKQEEEMRGEKIQRRKSDFLYLLQEVKRHHIFPLHEHIHRWMKERMMVEKKKKLHPLTL